MASFNSGAGITFPSPQPIQYGAPLVHLTQFTPNSTSSTNNLMFPSPPSLSSMNGVAGRGGILCSASNSRPTTSHCMSSSWQSNPSHTIHWAPTTIASPEMTMFNNAAASFSSNIFMAPTSPVPGTSGISQNASMNKSKRKSVNTDLSSSEEPQNKILVNEERMAARMQELHLDNNNLDWHPDLEHQQEQRVAEEWYSSSRNPSNNTEASSGSASERDPVTLTNCSSSSSSLSEDCDSDSSSSTSSHENNPQRRQRSKSCPKLDFSPELQLTLKTRRLLPQALLEELNKPCMQVMLWKPPGDVKDIMASVAAATKENRERQEPQMAVQVIDTPPDIITQQQQPVQQPNMWSIPGSRSNDLVEIDEDPMEDQDVMDL